MTPIQLLIEKLAAEQAAYRDAFIFGAGATKNWVDEDGHRRVAHISIHDFHIDVVTGEFHDRT